MEKEITQEEVIEIMTESKKIKFFENIDNTMIFVYNNAISLVELNKLDKELEKFEILLYLKGNFIHVFSLKKDEKGDYQRIKTKEELENMREIKND
jgi:hypothetical protein